MNYKERFLILLCTLFITQPSTLSAFDPSAPAPDMSQMSEDDFASWQKSMDEEIDNFVKGLPEDQQKQFNQDVAELTQLMENMSEQELADFIQNIFAQEDNLDTMPAPTMPSEPVAPVIVPEPVVVAPVLEGADKAIKMIENIITRTERFLRTTQRIPELPGRIDQWVEKDKVREWKNDLTWATLKKDIESLNQKVTQLKEKDPVTKSYRYINGLIKKESVYNNLTKLSENLTNAEPRVEAPSMGLGSVTKESREAIKKVLSAFAESIYTIELEQAIDQIIAEYEPRAKQLREEEEAARKKAIEESKKGLKESPRKVIGGKKADEGYQGDYGLEDYPYAPGYYPGSYDYDNYNPDKYTPDRKEDKDDAGKDAKTEAPKGKDGDKDKKEEVKRSDEFKKTIDFVENALNIVDDLLVDSASKDMKGYVQAISARAPGENTAEANAIKSAASALRRANRKMAAVVNKQEIADIRKRISSDKELMNIEAEMRSRRVDEDSNEALQELKMLADAISSLKSDNYTSATPIKRTVRPAPQAPAPVVAPQAAAPVAAAP